MAKSSFSPCCCQALPMFFQTKCTANLGCKSNLDRLDLSRSQANKSPRGATTALNDWAPTQKKVSLQPMNSKKKKNPKKRKTSRFSTDEERYFIRRPLSFPAFLPPSHSPISPPSEICARAERDLQEEGRDEEGRNVQQGPKNIYIIK